MPRKPRIEFAGAFYHILSRGDRGEPIYLDADDCRMFLATVAELCDRTGFLLHAYVLMLNHYHLLLETREANLVAGMKWFQGTYTQRFNARHQVSGHLFQGRYKSLVIDPGSGDYFRRVSDYIHLNPARAGLLEGSPPRLVSYPWSSFHEYIGSPGARPRYLRVERVFKSFGMSREDSSARKQYKNRLEKKALEATEGADGEDWSEIRHGWCLGDEDFRRRMGELIENNIHLHRRESYNGESLRNHDLDCAVQLLQKGLECLDISLPDLRRLKQSHPKKQGLVWLIKGHCVVPDEWLLKRLEMGHRSNISRAISAFRSPRDYERIALKQKLHICTD